MCKNICIYDVTLNLAVWWRFKGKLQQHTCAFVVKPAFRTPASHLGVPGGNPGSSVSYSVSCSRMSWGSPVRIWKHAQLNLASCEGNATQDNETYFPERQRGRSSPSHQVWGTKLSVDFNNSLADLVAFLSFEFPFSWSLVDQFDY